MNQITITQGSELIAATPRPADQNPAAVYLASLKPTGRRTQAQALAVMAGLMGADLQTMEWHRLRYQHTAAIRERLAEAYAPATVNKYLSALRQVLKHAWRLELMTAENYQRAADLGGVNGETLPAGRELTPGEILALMQACQNDQTPAGVRDAALLAVLYAGGLRRAEAVGAQLEDYNTDTGELVITGKRGKQRIVHLTNGAYAAMADWLQVRGTGSGSIFQAINKSGKITHGQLTAQAVYNILSKRGGEAGVAAFSPHDLRRTFVSDLLEAGVDIATVSKMAGHANVQTTARYDRRPEAAKKAAAKMLHLPYQQNRLLW